MLWVLPTSWSNTKGLKKVHKYSSSTSAFLGHQYPSSSNRVPSENCYEMWATWQRESPGLFEEIRNWILQLDDAHPHQNCGMLWFTKSVTMALENIYYDLGQSYNHSDWPKKGSIEASHRIWGGIWIRVQIHSQPLKHPSLLERSLALGAAAPLWVISASENANSSSTETQQRTGACHASNREGQGLDPCIATHFA